MQQVSVNATTVVCNLDHNEIKVRLKFVYHAVILASILVGHDVNRVTQRFIFNHYIRMIDL